MTKMTLPEAQNFRLANGTTVDLTALTGRDPAVFTTPASEVGTDPEDVRAGYGDTPAVGDIVATHSRGDTRVGVVTKVTKLTVTVTYTTKSAIVPRTVAKWGGVAVTTVRRRHGEVRYCDWPPAVDATPAVDTTATPGPDPILPPHGTARDVAEARCVTQLARAAGPARRHPIVGTPPKPYWYDLPSVARDWAVMAMLAATEGAGQPGMIDVLTFPHGGGTVVDVRVKRTDGVSASLRFLPRPPSDGGGYCTAPTATCYAPSRRPIGVTTARPPARALGWLRSGE